MKEHILFTLLVYINQLKFHSILEFFGQSIFHDFQSSSEIGLVYLSSVYTCTAVHMELRYLGLTVGIENDWKFLTLYRSELVTRVKSRLLQRLAVTELPYWKRNIEFLVREQRLLTAFVISFER